MTYDLIIVGAGPAGMTAAIYAARNKLKFLIIGMDVGGQVSWSSEVDNYPGLPDSTGIEVTNKFIKHLNDYKVKIKIEEVLDIKQKRRLLEVKTNKNKYLTKTIIIAAGKKPRKLNVPGEEKYLNKGVSYFATYNIPFYKNKEIAIAGSGNSGLESALFSAKHCKKVYILEIMQQINGDAYLRERVMKNKKIKIITGAKIKEIKGNSVVESLIYEKDGEEKILRVGGLFIEIGLVSKTDFARIVRKNDWDEIMIFRSTKTNEENMTSIPGVYAAGDCTDIPAKQIVVATGEGAKAALAAIDYLNKFKGK